MGMEAKALPVVTVDAEARIDQATNATPTTNPCKLCAPLGASTAFRGVRGAVPLLHGSQGCATYIRRYLISHFREPVDIASSSFGESAAIFGGGENLSLGLDNVIRQYEPELIGIATTCLAETIGDDVGLLLKQYASAREEQQLPVIVHASTPAYSGTQAEGFATTVRAIVSQLGEVAATDEPRVARVNLLPTMLSPEDLRYLRTFVESFGLECTLLPDYSESLDGGDWEQYEKLPAGGTPIPEIRKMPSARASIEFVSTQESAGSWLEEEGQVPLFRLPLPIGLQGSDQLVAALERISGTELAASYGAERARLVDAYMDGHKYVFEKRVVIFGEAELVVGLTAFALEIGMTPVLCATGGGKKSLRRALEQANLTLPESTLIADDVDFSQIESLSAELAPDLLLGNSKGLAVARALDCPLLRVGFPIHDRFGGARVLHVGYRGAIGLFDQIVNIFLAAKQAKNPVGYTYL